MKNKSLLVVLLLAFTSCAGWGRQCSSYTAENFGADWLVAQYKVDGTVLRCWKMENTSVTNESGSDGIYWKSPGGHLVHISGWYNRVQVERDDWKGAAEDLGVDLSTCK